MNLRRLAVLASVLLWLPVSTAGEATHGDFLAAGPVNYPRGATLTGDPLALLANASPDAAFTLSADAVTAYVYRGERIDSKIVVYAFVQHATFPLTNVTVTFGPETRDGWWGAYPETGARLDVALTAPADVVVKSGSEIASRIATPDQTTSSPEKPTYGRHLFPNHLESITKGALTMDFAGGIKFNGPDLLIRASENTTRILTGEVPSQGTTHVTWVTLEFTRAKLVTGPAQSSHFAFAEARSASQGDITFTAQGGTIDAGSGRYDAAGGPTIINGDFEGRLSPATSTGEVLRLVVDGQLQSTTLKERSVAATVVQPARFATWIAVGGVLFFAVGAVVGARLVMRRFPKPGLDELVARADAAAESGQFADALTWVKKARRLAPHSTRLCIDEAFYAAELGDVDGALALYQEASRISHDGEAAYLAAQLTASAGGSAPEVATLLAEALEKTPTLVLDAEDEAAFQRFTQDAAIQRILREASARMDEA